jgi:hypothetical protein
MFESLYNWPTFSSKQRRIETALLLRNPNELAFPFAGSPLNNRLLSFVHLPCIHLKSSLGRGHLRTASGSAFSLPNRKYADALPKLNTELHKWTFISK